MLTHIEIALVRGQLRQPGITGDTFGGELLARIFWANPEVRGSFPKDIF
ncbi:hypothetical protein MCEMSEM23_01141 [Rhabdaerophilaceae bacterium]